MMWFDVTLTPAVSRKTNYTGQWGDGGPSLDEAGNILELSALVHALLRFGRCLQDGRCELGTHTCRRWLSSLRLSELCWWRENQSCHYNDNSELSHSLLPPGKLYYGY